MTDISNAFIAGRVLQPLRCLVALLLVCVGLGATSSYAQNCTTRTDQFPNVMPPSVPLKTTSVNGEVSIGRASTIMTLTNCSGFPASGTLQWVLSYSPGFQSSASTVITTTSSSIETTLVFSCPGVGFRVCLNSSNIEVSQTNQNTNGVLLKIKFTAKGLKADGSSCITITGATFRSAITVNGLVIAANGSSCNSMTITADLDVSQNAVFPFASAQKLSIGNPIGATSGMGDITNSIGGFLNANPVNLRFPIGNTQVFGFNAEGTCALTLSSSTIALGSVSSALIASKNTNDVLVSKDLNIQIGGCSGFTLGKKKVLRWDFSSPNGSDSTRMENAALQLPSSGISAQIVADQKLRISNLTVLTSKTIVNGESYVASGGVSNSQNLNYKVNLIKNGEAIKEGDFSTTATVTMFYQ